MDVNKNPKFGNVFGRTYVGNSAIGIPVISGAGLGARTNTYLKGRGLYVLNADMTEALGNGTNATATGIFGTTGNSPWKMRLAPDNSLILNDFANVSNAVWQFSPDLTSSNLLLANLGSASTNHQQSFGTPYVSGSLAGGNLVVWIGDPNLAVPRDRKAHV